MNYTLSLLTHGDARTFGRAVESFADNVDPRPTAVCLFADGVSGSVLAKCVSWIEGCFELDGPFVVSSTHPDRQAGFCGATGRLWETAAHLEANEFVFWLEADFVFLRDVPLRRLADVLRAEPKLAQMSLIRDAVNDVEAQAGGLVAARPGEFTIMSEPPGFSWMRQRSYFTTNPSLMRQAFMVANPFTDDGQPFCEGRFGISLRQLGYSFGAWGEGEEWVVHMGIRDSTGKGY